MKKVTVTAVGRESDKFMLRLPEGMREQIAHAAKEHNRSMNAEIVSRLQESLGEKPFSLVPAQAETLRELERIIVGAMGKARKEAVGTFVKRVNEQRRLRRAESMKRAAVEDKMVLVKHLGDSAQYKNPTPHGPVAKSPQRRLNLKAASTRAEQTAPEQAERQKKK